MTRLTFKNEDNLHRLFTHAMGSTKHRPRVDDNKRAVVPSLMLVKDIGIYLMSSGVPRDFVTEDDEHLDGENFVVYAQGFHPGLDLRVDEKSDEAVGEDDFVEYFPIDDEMIARIEKGHDIVIEVTDNGLEILFVRGEPTTKH